MRPTGVIRSFLSTRLVLCLVVSANAAVCAAACSSSARSGESSAAGPVVLTIGFPHQTGQDPLHGAQQASRLLSLEGLTYLRRDGRPQPRLAESWVESEDHLTWTIKLRASAFFHDGSVVDAQSVKVSLERSLRSPNLDLSPGLLDIVGMDVVSPRELAIRLRAPSRFLLEDLSVAITKRSEGGVQIGTGPFVTDSASGDQLVMNAATNYYRGKPQIDRVVWKTYPAVRTAWAAMMRGEIDFLYEVPPEAVEFVQPETSVQVFHFLRNYAYLLIFNSQRKPFDDSRVRRALNYAVDREALIRRALGNRGQTAGSPMWPLHWAHDASVAGYTHDPSRSIALLDSAGIPPTTNQRERSPGRFHFRCLVPENFALWERMALIVQRDLAEVGVDMQIESVPFEVFNQRIGTHDFDAVIMELIIGNTPSRLYTFWSTASTQNVWGYKNPALDRAIDGLRRSSNDEEYRDAFRNVQLESVNDPPAIFLALGEVTRAVTKRFQVVAPPTSDIIPSLAEWHLAATGTPRTTN